MFANVRTAIAKRDMAAICSYAQKSLIKFSSMKIFHCTDGSRIWTFLQIVSDTGELSGTPERASPTWDLQSEESRGWSSGIPRSLTHSICGAKTASQS